MPAGGARNDPNQNPNSEMNILVTIFVVGAIALIAWWKASGYIVTGIFTLAWPKFLLLKSTLGLGPRGVAAFQMVDDVIHGRLESWNVPFSTLLFVMNGLGERLAYVYCAIIAGLAAYCWLKMPGNGFTQVHNLGSLIRQQAEYWGTLAVSANHNPDKAGSEWDQAMRPTDWIRANKITLSTKKGPDKRPLGLDEEAVRKTLEGQLGLPWTGLAPDTPLHHRALFVLFALHLQGLSDKTPDGKKIGASRLMSENLALAYSTMTGDKLTKRVDDLTRTWAKHKDVAAAIDMVTLPRIDANPDELDDDGNKVKPKAVGGNAYVNTALCQLLSECRKARGVLASAEFLWLKGVDRTLWYGLNNVGRRAFFVEGGGIIDHWQTEVCTNQPMSEPQVDQAVWGVKTYLEEQFIGDIDKFFKDETKPEWRVAA